MTEQRPSELEMQVLGVLWQRGASTVRDILAALPDRKPRAYTTVLAVMQGMQRKGLVEPTRQGQSYLYHPRVTQQQVVPSVLRTLTRNLFGGDPARAVQALLDSSDVSPDQLDQIRGVIDQAAQGAKKTGKKRGKT